MRAIRLVTFVLLAFALGLLIDAAIHRSSAFVIIPMLVGVVLAGAVVALSLRAKVAGVAKVLALALILIGTVAFLAALSSDYWIWFLVSVPEEMRHSEAGYARAFSTMLAVSGVAIGSLTSGWILYAIAYLKNRKKIS
jgi:hypothetical protein